jgi:hypothetical protein
MVGSDKIIGGVKENAAYPHFRTGAREDRKAAFIVKAADIL